MVEEYLSENNYLRKGKRIETLAREKVFKKPLKCYVQKEFNIFDLRAVKEKTFDKAVVKIAKEIKSALDDIKDNEVFMTNFYPEITGFLGEYEKEIKVSVENETNNDPEYRLLDEFGGYAKAKIELVEFKEVQYCPIGSTVNIKKGFRRDRKSPDICGWIDCFESTLAYVFVIERIQTAFREYIDTNEQRAYKRAMELCTEIFAFDYSYTDNIEEDFAECLKEQGYIFDSGRRKYSKAGNVKEIVVTDLRGLLPNDIKMKYYLFKCLQKKEYIPAKHLFRFHFNDYNFEKHGMSESKEVDILTFFRTLYLILNDEFEDYKKQQEYEKKINVSIATAYKTKKNIPQKIIDEMEQSRFNEYFGYVEFDEDVEIESVRTIADEFSDLNEHVFQGVKINDYAIRVRKLGKHRAAGIFFPMMNCMCVDIHSPGTFVHEFYHLLDDKLGNVSSQYEFFEICQKYKECLEKQILEDANLGILLGSKGKCDKKYYLLPTEIFARSGEIYLKRIKGVQSSLLKWEEENCFAYPESKELDKMIEEYFNAFHLKIH